MAHEIEKVTNPADPERCQAIVCDGKMQCYNRALPNSPYCVMHGGGSQEKQQNRRSIYELNSARMKARLQSKSSSPDVLTLHDEVGVLRILLEDYLNTIQDNDLHDIITKSGPISDLVSKIEKVVVSCNKLEMVRGQMLGRREMSQFAGSIAAAAAEEIKDPNGIKRFMDRVVAIMDSLGQENDDDRTDD